MVHIRLFHGLIGTLAFAALLISGCIVNPVPTSSTGGGGATAGQDGAAIDTFSASDSGVRFGGSDTATDSAASDVSGGVPPDDDAQIDAPHEPSAAQQRTAAVPVSSSVHAISSAPHASTVSANGFSG